MPLLPTWASGVHHDSSSAYLSNPIPKGGETVQVQLRIPRDASVNHIFLRTVPDGEIRMAEMQPVHETGTARIWQAEIHMSQPRMNYRFKLMTDEGALYYNARGIRRNESPDYHDFLLLADYQAPTWVTGGVFYQIFPDRFANGDPSNDVQAGEYDREGHTTVQRAWGEQPWKWESAGSLDFFGGDLQGITQHLDYIRSLGITGIYLCPIFESHSNHRYDIINFDHVDPHLGGDEALAELRQAMDERGMKLMLDITPNHVSFRHPWVLAAQADHNAASAEYFAQDPHDGTLETWLGVSSLVKLNYASQKLRDRMYRDEDSALRRWLKEPYRIDAWRLDVANMTGNLRFDQLDHEVHRELRVALKQDKPDLYILGEHFHDGTPHTQGDELDATMNYMGFNIPMRRWLGGEDLGVADEKDHGDVHLLPTEAMAEQWQSFMSVVPYVIALQQFNQLGSHDTTRILRVAGQDKDLALLGLGMMIAFPGVPCLYYGDEIGLDGGKDPDNRRCMPWDENEWDQEMLSFTRQVVQLRANSPALKEGGFQLLYAEGDLVAFLREHPQQSILAIGYRGQAPSPSVDIPVWQGGIAAGTQLTDLISGQRFSVTGDSLTLEGLAHGQTLLLQVD